MLFRKMENNIKKFINKLRKNVRKIVLNKIRMDKKYNIQNNNK
jgi:hypothetical protein